MTEPLPVGLTSLERVATSLIFSPTVAESVASVAISGLALLTVGFLVRVRAEAVGFLVVVVATEVGDPVVLAGGGRFEFFGGVFAVFFDFARGRAQGRDFDRAVGALEEVEGDRAFAGRADQFGERRDVFDFLADGGRGGRFGGDLRFRLFDFGFLVGVRAEAVGFLVVGVAREVGDPVVLAGGGRFEFFGGVFAVFFDFARGRAQGRDFDRAVGALEEVEGDRAFAGRVDQFGEGGDVFDFLADGGRVGRFGGDLRFRLFDFGFLVRVRAEAVGFLVVVVAKKWAIQWYSPAEVVSNSSEVYLPFSLTSLGVALRVVTLTEQSVPLKRSKVTEPLPVGLTSLESVATSLIFSPTVAEVVASVAISGFAFLTFGFLVRVRAEAVGFLVVVVA